MHKRRVLFLTTVLPSRKTAGGEYASQLIIESLEQLGHQVQVVGYLRKGDAAAIQENSLSICERKIETASAGLSAVYWMGQSLFTNLPYSAAKYYSRKYISIVQGTMNTQDFDLVVIDHAQIGWMIDHIRSSTKIVFISHNIEKNNYLHQADQKNGIAKYIYLREARLIEKMDMMCAENADEIWAMTEADANYFEINKPGNKVRILDIPSMPYTDTTTLPSVQFDIGLIGSWDWYFNKEGLRWFLREVYPLLEDTLSIHVAGKNGESICEEFSNVIHRGFVPDALQFMSEAKVIAIPTLGGSGIQIKFLEALSSGTKIVATSQAVRGIRELPNDVSVTGSASDFAASLVDAVERWNDQEEHTETVRLHRSAWMKKRQERFLSTLNRSISQTCHSSEHIS